MKVRLLYDLKDFKSIITLSKYGNDVLENLNDRQQRTLIKYLVSRNNFEDAEYLFKNFQINNEALYEDLEAAKDDVFYKYNWRQYKDKILELGGTEYTNIKEYKTYIDNQNGQMQSLGYVLIINQFFEKNDVVKILNEEFVPYINAEQTLLHYIDPAAIYKLDFSFADESDESIQLQNVLNQLYVGEQSQKLIRDIVQKLHKTQLTHQHIFSIRRLIIENRLDLSNDSVSELFKKNRKLEPVFYNVNLFTDVSNKIQMDKFVHDTFEKKQQKRIYNFVIKQLNSIDDENILPKYIMKYIEKNNVKISHSIVLAKQYYMTDQNEKIISLFKNRTKDRQLKMHVQLAKFLFNTKRYQQSLYEAEKAYDIKANNPDVLRGLIRAHHILGNITKRYEFIVKLKRINPERIFPGEFKMAEQEYRFLKQHWTLPAELIEADIEKDNDKVLFVLNKALPVVNGYTIRSNEIIKRVKERGFKPVVTTRLGWSPVHESYDIPKEPINGVQTYYIDRSDKYLTNKTPILNYFYAYAREIKNIINAEKPGIIHAASNYQNALPSLQLGKSLGIKTIYEVRGMWHHTQSSKIDGFQNSDRFNLQEQQEFNCCEIADEVFCISESLKTYLIDHGIDESKITVIPNGVDTSSIAPIEKNDEIIRKYNLKKYHVLGFIGSITSYEGLDLVIKAMKNLNNRMDLDKKFKLLIVGDGQYRSYLQSLTEKLDLQDYVIFTGRVSHEEISKYYSVIDVAPFARTDDLVCRLVTPLKTYEAMAMEKKVVVSDVDALQEMVIEGITGQIFEAENLEKLTESIIKIIDNSEIGDNARSWVVNNRDWSTIISLILTAYKIKP
ncbi:glycosyltransferase family 4 protein [Lacicoccus qingdaonensis]|uniref:glycosyltransferase family 4 protein n=1 Tax=Lacicoccus qingdaonensis TaxID=576118 RepID=UPI0015A03DD9|nr:glycosyltransferase family 4 protein [Salinicoccus qingdaonensis]